MPDDARRAVEALLAEVRRAEDAPPEAAPLGPRGRGPRDARWVRTDGLHLTLRFLGATNGETIPALEAAAREVAAATPPFDVVLGTGGAFPTPARPRVLWLGVLEGATQLADVAARLGPPLGSLGWPPDDRPFRAHLTVARTDATPWRTGAVLASRLAELAADVRIPFRAERVVLYRSRTGGGPARYEPLTEAAFGAR